MDVRPTRTGIQFQITAYFAKANAKDTIATVTKALAPSKASTTAKSRLAIARFTKSICDSSKYGKKINTYDDKFISTILDAVDKDGIVAGMNLASQMKGQSLPITTLRTWIRKYKNRTNDDEESISYVSKKRGRPIMMGKPVQDCAISYLKHFSSLGVSITHMLAKYDYHYYCNCYNEVFNYLTNCIGT